MNFSLRDPVRRDRKVSPDRGVRLVVCDGDLAIEGAVGIAYPGVNIQRCISHGDPVRMAPPQERSGGFGEAIPGPEECGA